MSNPFDAEKRDDVLYTLECGSRAFPTNYTYSQAKSVQLQYERTGVYPIIRAWCEKPK